jgi:SAM-dependent methyltransferase
MRIGRSAGNVAPRQAWSGAISIPSTSTEYQILPPVKELPYDTPWITFDTSTLEHDLDSYIAEDPYPIPITADREGYHGDRHYDYWLSGLKDYLLIKRALRAQNAAALLQETGVFDLGCASGRVLRHFLCHERSINLWAADLNLRHVEWVRRFLPPSVHVFQNSMLPHLPLEDNSFSLVYAFSVFTHIDAFELAWIAELRRILRPGGMAYLTVHTERTWSSMNPNRGLYHDILIMKDHITECPVCPEMFQSPMPRERMVLSWQTAAVNNAILFHSTDYIRNAWGRFLDIVEIQPEGHEYQDVVVLRKS